MKMKKNIIIAAIALAASCISGYAQEKLSNGLELDKAVHNFGDVMLADGPVTCEFTLTNKGKSPAVIYNVTTTCGCTDVEWTREPIRPGAKGKISVTYSNDEGPYPFDKSVTVYLSDMKKPIILKLRGVSMEEKKPLAELYPVSYGPFALKENLIKCGNLEQGLKKTEYEMVANTSSSPIKVEFADVSENLSISVSPNPIPANSTAEMTFTVTADKDLWGKNTYYSTPVINGKRYTNTEGDKKIGIWAFTKENFSHLTQQQKENGPIPMFDDSTFSFNKAKQGTEIHAKFKVKNEGKETLQVYKVDVNTCKWSHSTFPAVAPGQEAEFRVHLDTANMPKGEALAIVTLVTNSPLRPIVNLFIAGWLE